MGDSKVVGGRPRPAPVVEGSRGFSSQASLLGVAYQCSRLSVFIPSSTKSTPVPSGATASPERVPLGLVSPGFDIVALTASQPAAAGQLLASLLGARSLHGRRRTAEL